MGNRAKAILWTVVIIPAIGYVTGYVALGRRSDQPSSTVRTFSSTAAAFAYAPLGWFEAKVSRRAVLFDMPGRSEFENRMICFDP